MRKIVTLNVKNDEKKKSLKFDDDKCRIEIYNLFLLFRIKGKWE